MKLQRATRITSKDRRNGQGSNSTVRKDRWVALVRFCTNQLSVEAGSRDEAPPRTPIVRQVRSH